MFGIKTVAAAILRELRLAQSGGFQDRVERVMGGPASGQEPSFGRVIVVRQKKPLAAGLFAPVVERGGAEAFFSVSTPHDP